MKISVLTPAYNAEAYIAATIESILHQTYSDFEYIICDDCSRDNTLSIINKYAGTDARIKVIRNEPNLGIAETRNRLISCANGEYIVWQEADDISLPHRIEHQVDFMDRNLGTGICGGYLECFSGDRVVGVRRYPTTDRDLRRVVFRYAPVAQPAAIIRKACIDELGLYRKEFTPADDLEMTLRLGTRYELANLPEIVLRFRIHNDSTSTTFTKLKKLELNTLRIRDLYRKDYDFTIPDRLYNIAQFVSIYLIPARLKISLFNAFRNSKQ